MLIIRSVFLIFKNIFCVYPVHVKHEIYLINSKTYQNSFLIKYIKLDLSFNKYLRIFVYPYRNFQDAIKRGFYAFYIFIMFSLSFSTNDSHTIVFWGCQCFTVSVLSLYQSVCPAQRWLLSLKKPFP